MYFMSRTFTQSPAHLLGLNKVCVVSWGPRVFSAASTFFLLFSRPLSQPLSELSVWELEPHQPRAACPIALTHLEDNLHSEDRGERDVKIPKDLVVEQGREQSVRGAERYVTITITTFIILTTITTIIITTATTILSFTNTTNFITILISTSTIFTITTTIPSPPPPPSLSSSGNQSLSCPCYDGTVQKQCSGQFWPSRNLNAVKLMPIAT